MRLWPALDVHPPASPEADAEELQGTILAALDEATVTAVQEQPAGWRLFFTTPEARDRAIDTLTGWNAGLRLASVDVSDEDWARRSQENLGPVRVLAIRISPPWAEPEPEPGSSPALHGDPAAGIDIIIQPSMGFGTGHHASTRLCTALLQQIDLGGRQVLDVGTGSGVLAIVALRLGALAVLAIDDDADALESARENLELNKITGGIELRQADFRSLAGATFDVVTANLTGGLLVRGASSLLPTLAPGAQLILSGITLEEEAEVRSAFDPHLSLGARLDEDGWVGLRYELRTGK